jgi:hypothetical protein
MYCVWSTVRKSTGCSVSGINRQQTRCTVWGNRRQFTYTWVWGTDRLLTGNCFGVLTVSGHTLVGDVLMMEIVECKLLTETGWLAVWGIESHFTECKLWGSDSEQARLRELPADNREAVLRKVLTDFDTNPGIRGWLEISRLFYGRS